MTAVEKVILKRALEARLRHVHGWFSPVSPAEADACAKLAEDDLLTVADRLETTGSIIYHMTDEQADRYAALSVEGHL